MRRAILIAAALCFGMTVEVSAQAIDKTLLARIHVIAFGAVAEPAFYAIVSSSGNSPQYDSRTFVPGAGVSGARPSLNQAMAAQNFRLGAELHDAVADALMRDGYDVVSSPGGAADAMLEIAILPGTAQYSDAVLGDDLMPSFVALVRMIDARTHALLFRDRILYGQPADRNAHALYPDARYRFSSADALLAEPQVAAEGFRAGVAMVARELGQELAK
jgi:hypothetical protein